MDISIDVKIPDTPLFKGEGSEVVRQQLVADVEYGVNAIQAAVMPETPVGATSLARGGWQTSVNLTGTPVDVLGRVFNLVPYAVPLERGARPHFPPVAALELWVRRKLSVAEKDVRSVAFLVARKISRVGTSGAAMAHKAVERVTPAVEARFKAGLAVIVQRLGR